MINKNLLVDALKPKPTIAKDKHTQQHAWARQLATAQEILGRFGNQPGIVLADDAGLGKTWVAALVARNVMLNGGNVLILVPKKALKDKWRADIKEVRSRLNLDDNKMGKFTLLTHDDFAKLVVEGRDLLIVDEAHRSRRYESSFRKKLRETTKQFGAKLFLTATPFSLSVEELDELLTLVSGSDSDERSKTLKDFAELAGPTRDGKKIDLKEAESTWKSAVTQLKPLIIRHTIDGLNEERKEFGDRKDWVIEVPAAEEATIEILARVDRLFNLDRSNGKRAFRGGDPRFHIGWDYLRLLLSTDLPTDWAKIGGHHPVPEKLAERNADVQAHIKGIDRLGDWHANEIRKYLDKAGQHPKIKAVVDAVVKRVADGEKVIVFCHHHATLHEVFRALKSHKELQQRNRRLTVKERTNWRTAWETLLKRKPIFRKSHELLQDMLDWVSSSSFYLQVSGWIGQPSDGNWEKHLNEARIRRQPAGSRAPTIVEAVLEIAYAEQQRHGGLEDDDDSEPFSFSFKQHKRWERVTTAQSDDLAAQLALFNTPFGPDVLVATDRLSEAIDLHGCCRLLVHYELDPSPIRVRQREGRVRRIGGWAQRIGQPVEYAYPAFAGTRDEALIRIVRQRLQRFDLLLGGVQNVSDVDEEAVEEVDRSLFDKLTKELGDQVVNCLALSGDFT